METREKVIEAMGGGLNAEKTALALGLSPSTVSALLAEPEVSAKIQELRFLNMQSHNSHDRALDSLEDKVIKKLDATIALEFNPSKLAGILARVNAAKRRGSSAPESLIASKEVVTLRLPQVTLNHFTTNINNQVIQVGSQELVTIQSGTLLKQVKGAQSERASLEGQGESSANVARITTTGGSE